MIKNTSGLAVQPCRLHERFYYHARLLYYILRQKARGFFARGQEAPAPPFFLSASPEGFCGGGGPSTSGSKSSDLAPRSALHPGEIYAGLAAPAPNDARGSPSALPRAGAPPRAPGDFRFTTKVTKGVSGGAPLNPRGGHYHPPSGVAAPPRRTLPLGVGGGVGLCFPPRRIGVSGCRYPFLYSGKNCCEPGGKHRPYIADRGRLGCSCNESNESTELS